eukprot:SAG31_NODE_6547_length_1981_cov_2.016472_2_plen_47_part_00
MCAPRNPGLIEKVSPCSANSFVALVAGSGGFFMLLVGALGIYAAKV